jgi:hypothetical protein
MEICLLGLILSIIDKFSNRIDQTIGFLGYTIDVQRVVQYNMQEKNNKIDSNKGCRQADNKT